MTLSPGDGTDTAGRNDMKNKTWRIARNSSWKLNEMVHEEIMSNLEDCVFHDFENTLHYVPELEQELAQAFGFRHVICCASGSAAILLGLLALGVKPGDEVITAANSDVSDTNSILHARGVPIYCDIDPDDYTIDPQKIEALITPKTKVLMPIDIYGHPADVRIIREIADQHGLKVLEDAALASCSKDYGKPVGTFADATLFSTISSKSIQSAGYGGFIGTNDSEIAERAELFRGYGIKKESGGIPDMKNYVTAGYNLMMNPLDAAVLLPKLKLFPEAMEKRRRIMKLYTDMLCDNEAVSVPKFRQGSDPVPREFVIRVLSDGTTSEKRDRLFTMLRENGVQVTTGYTPPAHQRMFHEYGCGERHGDLSVTERLGLEMLSLPVDPSLTKEDIRYICDIINHFSYQN